MIIDFLGRFHPLLVHLPIGFFLLAFAFKILSYWKHKDIIGQLLPLMLLLSLVASLFSSATGYLLSQSGDYDNDMIFNHQWSGIVFTALILVVYLFRKNPTLNLALWVITTGVLMVVGHLGGSLTHGEDFLSFSSPKIEKKPIVDVQKALIYSDLIKPIFEEKCYSCHSSKKQKGNFRLDTPAFIIKGGKEGKGIVPHNLEKSLISERILLPESQEEHMPPKGKSQLTEAETKVLNWWIKEGANFEKTVSQTNQNAEIKLALLTFQASKNSIQNGVADNMPGKEVEKGSEESIAELKKSGILALPVSTNSNYLLINLRGIVPSKKDIEAMRNLSKQIVWFNATQVQNSDDLVDLLNGLKELRILHLNKTKFSDKGLLGLKNMNQLQILNLSNTEITENGLQSLGQFKSLRKVFLFQSKVKFSLLDFSKFPQIKIDTGGYKVPTFESDTSIVSANI